MKALSLIQPWASFLFPFAGRPAMKLHETRSWATRHRGAIAIHASTAFRRTQQWIYSDLLTGIERQLSDADKRSFVANTPEAKDIPRGCIIGIVELVDCQPAESVKPDTIDAIFGNFTPGRYAWRMAKPVLFRKPIPCKGALGLWEVPDEIKFSIEMEYLKT